MSYPFFNRRLDQFDANVALKSDADSIAYASLQHSINERISEWNTQLTCRRPLMLIRMANTIDSVINYLGCLQASYPCIVMNADSPAHVVASIQRQFSPNLILSENRFQFVSGQQHHLADELAVLLSTSGSTGSQQFVALSSQNIIANTRSILAYLPIAKTDLALGSLPFSYSYGLSVLHTHLAVGAAIRLTNLTVMDKGFWDVLESDSISSIHGVPSWYEMLLRLRFERKELSALRYFTQAGGKLAAPSVTRLAEYARDRKKQFFVMYGQTEATARIAYLPANKPLVKPASIGQAIPEGQLSLVSEHGESIDLPYKRGQLVYKGPNVMLGYASGAEELAAFSSPGLLHTGDLGYFDEDGDFFVTGRLKRMIKLFGERCSLDEIENHLQQAGFDVRCIGNDNQLAICYKPGNSDGLMQQTLELLRVPPKAIKIKEIREWPLLANNKIDYPALHHQVFAKA